MIGEVRVDLEHPNATNRADVLDFVQSDTRSWPWVLLDPPYELVRKRKLAAYARPIALTSDVKLRNAFCEWARLHATNLLWLDYVTPKPAGFERVKLWAFLMGGYHPPVWLSWLRATPAPLFTTPGAPHGD